MRVVHINVRLGEGGAARIALDLHKRARKDGIESIFFYGYGTGARRSVYQSSVPGSMQLAKRSSVMLNYAIHRLFGVEFFPPSRERANLLRQTITNSDVVHLHAIHSYFLPFGWLSKMLMDAKKIIWTCHDFWPITGRCASPEGCNGWKHGCCSCPTVINYPPVFWDISAYLFKKKRLEILRHKDRITFVAPSKYVYEQYREAFPQIQVEIVYNGIDSDLENELKRIPTKQSPDNNGITKIILIANDLSDPTKVDRKLINEVISLPGVELHIIGNNSPFCHNQVINHGEIRQRKKLISVLQNMHVLLFTSRKDTFGLVMIEALVCGVPVLALSSSAAAEVLNFIGARTVQSIQEVLSCIKEKSWWKLYSFNNREELKKKSLLQFSGDLMYNSYYRLYTG